MATKAGVPKLTVPTLNLRPNAAAAAAAPGAPAPAPADGTETANSLVASMRAEMARGFHSLSTFVGNFHQLLKCEMGTSAFKAKLDRIPLKNEIERVGLFINTGEARDPSPEEMLAIEAICRKWCQPSVYLEVRQQLIELPYSFRDLRGHDRGTKRDLAAFLMEFLLIPILQDPALR